MNDKKMESRVDFIFLSSIFLSIFHSLSNSSLVCPYEEPAQRIGQRLKGTATRFLSIDIPIVEVTLKGCRGLAGHVRFSWGSWA